MPAPAYPGEGAISLCAGPGGFDQAARVLGGLPDFLGFDISEDACNTARTAGFRRHRTDITTLRPADFPDAHTLIFTPPCPPFSSAGKGIGRHHDHPIVHAAIVHAGTANPAITYTVEGKPRPGCGCTWDQIRRTLDACQDPLSPLVAWTIAFALGMPNLRTLILEEVPGVEDLFRTIADQLERNGWQHTNVFINQAADLGLPTLRRRVFLIAHRDTTSTATVTPGHRYLPRTTLADALDWPGGQVIVTRGERKTPGGNGFPADKTGWCLTGKARNWKRLSPGGPDFATAPLAFTVEEGSLLLGFPADFPWQGSRSSIFQQIADVVSPLAGIGVLAAAYRRPWQETLHAYYRTLYCATATPPTATAPLWIPNATGQYTLI